MRGAKREMTPPDHFSGLRNSVLKEGVADLQDQHKESASEMVHRTHTQGACPQR